MSRKSQPALQQNIRSSCHVTSFTSSSSSSSSSGGVTVIVSDTVVSITVSRMSCTSDTSIAVVAGGLFLSVLSSLLLIPCSSLI